ncbi:FecR family protein [Sphingomonas aestuarii]
MPMTSAFTPEMMDAARGWAIRVRDPAFADWDGFTGWLEADTRHAAAYDAACDADAAVVELFAKSAPIAMPDGHARPAPRRVSRRWVAGGGAVAAALALAFVYTDRQPASAPYSIATRAGVSQTIDLEPGTQIVLNGDSRVTLDRERPRYASLDRGEALFVVRHDDARPFTVNVGAAKLVDLGTIFNVARTDDATRIAVSEGVVMYNPDSDAVRLDAGKSLEVAEGRLTMRSVSLDAVGSWRDGTLVYDNAPLPQVVGDLSRSLGVAVTLSPDLRARRFTGTLAVRGSPADVLPRVAPLLGGVASSNDGGWTVSSRAQP